MVTFVLPIIIIGICTVHMTIVLWCRQPVGVITPQLERAKGKKQKVCTKKINYNMHMYMKRTIP
jgi:hypothetical protein